MLDVVGVSRASRYWVRFSPWRPVISPLRTASSNLTKFASRRPSLGRRSGVRRRLAFHAEFGTSTGTGYRRCHDGDRR